jgi:hypothetical protein
MLRTSPRGTRVAISRPFLQFSRQRSDMLPVLVVHGTGMSLWSYQARAFLAPSSHMTTGGNKCEDVHKHVENAQACELRNDCLLDWGFVFNKTRTRAKIYIGTF